MLRQTIALLFLGFALAYPSPDSKAVSQLHSNPTIQTPLGPVQGTVLATRLGKPLFAFRGIRYAKAPVNELRFQPPVPVEKWDATFNATVDGPSCPQVGADSTSEDCLLLNVYTTKLPKANENDKRSVLVYFHPGGFLFGSANSTAVSPRYLLDEDIVLVVPNYRLGILGFLSTGDKEAPGNNGLKDQVQALKWVKENIAAFGGDPECITISGDSAGAAAVTLHLVSPLSKDLFDKAIAMSGSSLGNWPVPQNQLALAKKQAKLLNCPDDNAANIIKCLKSKTADELVESALKLKEFGSDPCVLYLPVIEQDFGQPRFLTAHPVELVLNDQFSKVPFLTGVTTDEMVHFAFAVINNPKLAQDLDKNWEKNAPIAFLYERDTENSKAISKDLRKFYLDDKPLDNSSISALVQLYSDGVVGFGVNRAAKLLAEKSNEPVFYYRFNFKGRHSYFYLPDSNNTVPYGVAHTDDLIYLLPNIPSGFTGYKEDDPETNTIEKMTKLWGNFIKTGKPVPETSDALDNVKWEPFKVKAKKYLEIGNKLVLNENLYEKRYAEWEKLFPLSKYQSKGKKQHG